MLVFIETEKRSIIGDYMDKFLTFVDNPKVEFIVTLPDDKEKWLKNFKFLENTREEMYSSEKMDKVYEKYLEYYEKFIKNGIKCQKYDMFSNMEGLYKGYNIDIIETDE